MHWTGKQSNCLLNIDSGRRASNYSRQAAGRSSESCLWPKTIQLHDMIILVPLIHLGSDQTAISCSNRI